MIRYVKGTLEFVEEDAVIVDNHGMGYRILVSPSFLQELPPVGQEVKIYTYLNVREDAMQLYGFRNMDELEVFRLLITVSGIGPKGGLSVLGVLSADEVRFAVMSEDAAAIAKAPGVGAKTAKKVIVELKDKLDWTAAVDQALDHAQTGGTDNVSSRQGVAASAAEAAEALTALGYASADAWKAVRQVEDADTLSTEEILRKALQWM